MVQKSRSTEELHTTEISNAYTELPNSILGIEELAESSEASTTRLPLESFSMDLAKAEELRSY